MPLDYSDPTVLKYIIEINTNNNLQGLRWFLKHKDEMIKKAQLTDHHKHYTGKQIERKQVELGISALCTQHEENGRHRRKSVLGEANILNKLLMKSEQSENMKPVDEKESSLLYKELMDGGGRVAYLKSRKRKIPEDKYNYCETSSVYGWGLKQSSVGYSVPKCPRYSAYLHDIMRNSGVREDPPHYEPPTELIYRKCIGFT